eukprot:TRINITY_DN2221_c0_g1_i2.p1 TRINITY_DN2221_c0_g1~~TRINITY_DN2221_c0_g1_i2.p1  ORF type:complete len:721 (-),score=206.27 TRINITY_DN2221_c0_g1_i2:490-2652(-)
MMRSSSLLRVFAVAFVVVIVVCDSQSISNELECGLRTLGLKFAQQLQPFRSQETFSLMSDQLLIPHFCGTSDGAEMGSVDLPANELLVIPLNDPQDSIYVDFNHGSDDAGTGSIDSPLKTLQSALDLSREMRGAGGRRSRRGLRAKITIFLREGIHYLNDTIKLAPADSNLTIQAYPGEEAWISGGLVLKGLKWVQQGNSSVWVAKVGPNFQAPQVSNDVLGLNTLNPHTRLTRARYPNSHVEDSPGAWIHPETITRWLKPDPPLPKPTTYFKDLAALGLKNDSTMPNYNQYGLGYGGACEVWTPAESYWCSNISAGGWAEMDLKGPILPVGMTVNDTSVNRAQIWMEEINKKPGRALAYMWRWQGWFVSMHEVVNARLNGSDQPGLTFDFGKGGDQAGRGWHVDDENNLRGDQWLMDNLLSELDSVNEWYFDNETQELWLYSNSTVDAPPSDDYFVVPVLKHLIQIQGTSKEPVVSVSVVGVSFRDAAYTYMDPHGVPSGGDWALQRSGAVFLEGTESCSVSSCTFRRLDGNALFLSGYNRHTLITKNDFSFIGDSAMASWGFTNFEDGTNGEQPRFTTVSFNIAREVGHFQKQSSMWFQAKTAQTTLEGNIFFNTPRAAINFNDGFGGGNVVKNNVIFNTCKESGDHGPINSWDRQPFLTDVRDGTPSYTPAMNDIQRNFIIANYGGSQGFDNDDGSSWYSIHHVRDFLDFLHLTVVA